MNQAATIQQLRNQISTQKEDQRQSISALDALRKEVEEYRAAAKISMETMDAAGARIFELRQELVTNNKRIEKLLKEVSWFKKIMRAGANRAAV
jgi:uncharacterized coiled-coil DUF342 family protein